MAVLAASKPRQEGMEMFWGGDPVHIPRGFHRIDELAKLRHQILIDIPDHFEQRLRYLEHLASLGTILALLPSRARDLTFRRPPKMHPDRMIDQDNRIRGRKPSFQSRPWPPAVDQPTLATKQGVQRGGDLCHRQRLPARSPLKSIDCMEWETAFVGKAPSEG